MDQCFSCLRRTDPGLAASGFAGGENQLFIVDGIQIMRLSFIARLNWGSITAVPRHANCFYATHLHKRCDRFFFTLFMAT